MQGGMPAAHVSSGRGLHTWCRLTESVDNERLHRFMLPQPRWLWHPLMPPGMIAEVSKCTCSRTCDSKARCRCVCSDRITRRPRVQSRLDGRGLLGEEASWDGFEEFVRNPKVSPREFYAADASRHENTLDPRSFLRREPRRAFGHKHRIGARPSTLRSPPGSHSDSFIAAMPGACDGRSSAEKETAAESHLPLPDYVGRPSQASCTAPSAMRRTPARRPNTSCPTRAAPYVRLEVPVAGGNLRLHAGLEHPLLECTPAQARNPERIERVAAPVLDLSLQLRVALIELHEHVGQADLRDLLERRGRLQRRAHGSARRHR